MNPTPILLGACAALLSLTTTFSGQDPAGDPARGGALRRIDPSRPDREQGPVQDLLHSFTGQFDRNDWRARLSAADLDRREQDFERLVEFARLDPGARAFLEDLARDPQAGELAWTARLALRELGRARFPLQGMLPGGDPFGRLGPLGNGERMERLLQELLDEGGLGLFLPTPGQRGSAPLALGQAAGRSVRIEQDEHGARVEVRSNVDGKESTQTFEGQSLEAILEAHPELEQELGGLRLQLGPRASLERGLRLAPQGRTRPIATDKLGVIVQPLTAEHARELGLEDRGLYVERSYPGTYAHLLGVEGGDVLLELDGTPLRTSEDIERVMRARGADEDLTLVWLDELGQRQQKTWRAPRVKDGR